MSLRVIFIAYSETVHVSDFNLLQERIAEIRCSMKFAQHIGAVLGHGRHVDSFGFEPSAPLFQLNQLGLAQRPPVGRPVHE